MLMKEAGMKSIRLPIVFAKITDTLPPYYVDTNHAIFERIDSVIKWTDELDMNLIIDNHHEWNLADDTWRKNIERFGHLWSVVAERYKHLNPDQYFFELLNEPAFLLSNDSLSIIFNAAIDSIRQHTTQHTIIASPSLGSWGVAYDTYLPLADTNLIYTWHCYDPINFTHQGLVWNNPFYPAGTTFPSPGSIYEQFLYDGVQSVTNWKATHNKPVFLGEFGVSNYADSVSRCNWFEFVGNTLYQNNIPYFYWDWQWDFTMFRSNVISADSIIPCVSRALRLYGDSLYSSVNNFSKNKLNTAKLFPTVVSNGSNCFIEVGGENHFEVKIMDATGKVILTENFFSESGNMKINLENGLYFVEIKAGNKIDIKKLIVI